jgi:hypothetical protein
MFECWRSRLRLLWISIWKGTRGFRARLVGMEGIEVRCLNWAEDMIPCRCCVRILQLAAETTRPLSPGSLLRSMFCVMLALI